MPHQLEFEGQSLTVQTGETVLDALLRVGAPVAFSCKGGTCHTCMLQCTAGQVSERSQRDLPARLSSLGYFLPCQCQASDDMTVRSPRPQDLVTACMLCEVDDDGRVLFEPQSTLRYRKGQTLRVVGTQNGGPEFAITITSDPAVDMVMHGQLAGQGRAAAAKALPALFGPDAEFGAMFEVRGPFDAPPAQEQEMPPTDIALWHQLDEGRQVRAVLEAFYPKVYANAQLAPFFRGVTMQRVIDKQYAFLRQAMTGEKLYFGDRPRNAHHWMIITHELFDLRQALMEQAQRELGLSDEQIDRWRVFEESFRPDIVKSQAWPRVDNGVETLLEGFDREVLTEGTLCDHCHAEVARGVEVLYHRRTGTISCPQCAPTTVAQESASHPAST